MPCPSFDALLTSLLIICVLSTSLLEMSVCAAPSCRTGQRNEEPACSSWSGLLTSSLSNHNFLADVAQYHTWLLSKVPNSQPIYLLSFLPGYPLLNFSVVTGLYIFLSHRLFLLTATLRDAVVPHDDNACLRRNFLTMALGAAVLWGVGFLAVEAAKVA